jgi:hypothetical protein
VDLVAQVPAASRGSTRPRAVRERRCGLAPACWPQGPSRSRTGGSRDCTLSAHDAANAEVLVAGDVGLLSLDEPGVQVMTPRDLVERLEL